MGRTHQSPKPKQENMMNIISAILEFFRPMSQQQWEENYLAKSVDLFDLERRQQELTRKGNRLY